jgi:hypothetical protein
MKPVLTLEMKTILMQEFLEWVLSNTRIMCVDTPKLQALEVVRSICIDSSRPVSVNNSCILIRELKENGPLWHKILPFLYNTRSSCSARTDNGRCNHKKELHDETGKCTAMLLYDRHWNKIDPQPCSCNHYKTNQDW